MDFSLEQLATTPAFRTALSSGAVPYGLSQDAIQNITLMGQITVMLNAYDDVKARIDKYGVPLTLDRAKAAQAKVDLQAWANDHAGTIRTMDAKAPLPEGILPKLPPPLAYAWVCSLWSDASMGIELYRQGIVREAVEAGVTSQADALDELAYKKKVLEALTALDAEGHLATILEAKKSGLAGWGGLGALGLGPLTPAGLYIVIAIIAAVAAVLIAVIVSIDKTARYAAQHDDQCKWARENGKTIESWICASSLDPATVAIVVGGSVLLLMFLAQYTLPRYVSGTVDFLDGKFKDSWR